MKRVVTIKVPILPFTMPVMNLMASQEEEEIQAAKMRRKVRKLKRKRKLAKEAAKKLEIVSSKLITCFSSLFVWDIPCTIVIQYCDMEQPQT